MAWPFAVIGGSATIRPRFMRRLFLEEIPLKDLAGLGEPAPAPFLLRMSCARGSFGQTRFSHKTLYGGFVDEIFISTGIQRHIYIAV